MSTPSLRFELCSKQELEPELQLAHGRAELDISDRTAVAGAIDAGATGSVEVLRAEVQYRMIKYVKRIHPELQLEALREAEVLGDGHIVGERSRAGEGIPSYIALPAARGQRERPGGGAR